MKQHLKLQLTYTFQYVNNNKTPELFEHKTHNFKVCNLLATRYLTFDFDEGQRYPYEPFQTLKWHGSLADLFMCGISSLCISHQDKRQFTISFINNTGLGSNASAKVTILHPSKPLRYMCQKMKYIMLEEFITTFY